MPRLKLSLVALAVLCVVPPGCFFGANGVYVGYGYPQGYNPSVASSEAVARPVVDRPNLRPSEPLVPTRRLRLWSVAPTASTPRDWSPPVVEISTISNGMTLYFVQNHDTDEVAVRYCNREGGEDDIQQSPGLAWSTVELLTRGSQAHPGRSLHRAFRSLSSNLSARISNSDAQLTVDSLPGDFSATLELLAEAVTEPELAPHEFAFVQQEQLTARTREIESVAAVADRFAYEQLYGPHHRLGLPLIGTEQDINRRQLAHVQQFYAERYIPAHSALVVVGPLPSSEVLAVVERTFGRWRSPVVARQAIPVGVLRAAAPHQMNFIQTSSTTTSITISFRLPAAGTPDFYKLLLLNKILGGLQTSRIGQSIRTQAGYSYSPMSSIEIESIGGMLTIEMVTEPDRTPFAIARAFNEVLSLRQTLPSDQELSNAKLALSGAFVGQFGESYSTATFVGRIFLDRLTLDFMNQYRSRVASVTGAEVQNVAQLYLNLDRAVVVIVGDRRTSNVDAIGRLGFGPVSFFTPLATSRSASVVTNVHQSL